MEERNSKKGKIEWEEREERNKREENEKMERDRI